MPQIRPMCSKYTIRCTDCGVTHNYILRCSKCNLVGQDKVCSTVEIMIPELECGPKDCPLCMALAEYDAVEAFEAERALGKGRSGIRKLSKRMAKACRVM